jgi:hypothetical protein
VKREEAEEDNADSLVSAALRPILSSFREEAEAPPVTLPKTFEDTTATETAAKSNIGEVIMRAKKIEDRRR